MIYYYLSLTDQNKKDNALTIYPNTNEVVSYTYAVDYLLKIKKIHENKD